MKQITVLFLTILSGTSLAADQSQYAGEEFRSIKSLSAEQIESLKTGKGMGFAKLAELNHYPGPKHVLELADALQLTPSQVAETEDLFKEMQLNAISLGKKLLQAEMNLDHDFSRGTVNTDSLKNTVGDIGSIRAQLRYVHLEAHLRQKGLLTQEQIAKYDEIRGYGHAIHSHNGHAKNHK